MTGLSDQSHLLEGLQAGGVDYLTKPVNLDELLLRARTHMANGQKTRLARSALNAMGVATLICDVHGDLRWQSEQAEALFEQLGQTAYQRVRQSLQQWLQHGPEKNMQLSVPLMTAKTAMDKDMPGQETAPSVTESLQLRMIGRPSPSDYLVRLVDNSDLALQQVLRSEFALTDREAEVLLWISRGKTNREIAQILNLSPRTINKHLEPIFRKLGVENRTSAAAASLQALPVQ